MTFLGFLLNGNGDLLNPGTNQVLEKNIMNSTLTRQLKEQGVGFDANYEKRDRLDLTKVYVLSPRFDSHFNLFNQQIKMYLQIRFFYCMQRFFVKLTM